MTRTYTGCYTALAVIALLILSACSHSTQADPAQLNGYWEISSVQLENSSLKEFSISTTVDFIEITDSLGMRKKVNPQLDGTFKTSDNFETFSIATENDSLRLRYTTAFDSWFETVLSTTDSTFSILNKDRKIYNYKRFKAFNFKSN